MKTHRAVRSVEARVGAPEARSTTRYLSFEDIEQQIIAEQRTQRNRLLLSSWLVRLLFAAVLIGGWYALTKLGIVSEAIASSPGQVASYLAQELPTSELWYNVWITFEATVVGLLVGSVGGITVGIVLYEFDILRRGLDPFIAFFNSLPRPALAPIFLLWFGLGMGAKVAVAASIVFFVLLVTTLAGLASATDDHLFFSESLGLTRLQRLRFIQLPTAAPSIISGLRLGVVYSVLGVVVSEMVSAYAGLGQVLIEETNRFNIAGAFGVLIVLAVLAAVLNQLLTLAEVWLPWLRYKR